MRKLIAFTLPMAVFVFCSALPAEAIEAGRRVSWLSYPAYWMYPGQTVICGALLFWFWRDYEFRAPAKVWFALRAGLVVFALWITPQQFLGFEPRLVGFDPDLFAARPVTVLGDGRFSFFAACDRRAASRRSFLAWISPPLSDQRAIYDSRDWDLLLALVRRVTIAFGFAHSRPDWIAALICGAVYNLVAYRTRSLASCVLAHATTNLLLGIWIMQTRQWGFW